jgi:kumamolisin
VFEEWTELVGSSRKSAKGTMVGLERSPEEVVELLIKLRPRNKLPSHALRSERITRNEYRAKYGAHAKDIEAVQAFARQFELPVQAVLSAERIVLLSGTVAKCRKAFKVALRTHQDAMGRTYRGREGPIHIPTDLAEIVVGVFGLDDRPIARRRYKATRVSTKSKRKLSAYYAQKVSAFYSFPKGLSGIGQAIGIIELGGGFHAKDLDVYFDAAAVPCKPRVQVAKVVGGGENKPHESLSKHLADGEVALDIEIIGSIAYRSDIFVYFGKDSSSQQFFRAVSAAIHDEVTDLSVISISWTGPEFEKGMEHAIGIEKQFQDAMNEALQAAALLGITVCVASGDHASYGSTSSSDRRAHVGFPSSSPFALACGGTRILKLKGGAPVESVWHSNARVGSGGGVSRYFKVPKYQQFANIPRAVSPSGKKGRGVPDVSGNAAFASGYRIYVDGQWLPSNSSQAQLDPAGGTSAVAPLWAALIALINESLKTRLGFVNPLLYQIGSPSKAFNDIVRGNNGDYRAQKGWDPCTGLGTPRGENLLIALQGLVPQRLRRTD